MSKLSACVHKFVKGSGVMGDGVICVKCGLDTYPESLGIVLSKLANTAKPIIPEDNTQSIEYFSSHDSYPFVRLYTSESEEYSYYYDKSGIVCKKGDFHG